ncbi:unnamed protein product [Sphenostylis stenocarpa]|uniref:Uncharacterized protein n=1 Tax=Sphenostylis stenocarpa TaxID=92480 RepID=A0AA86VG06_9FABA|nr:unnamed protein product [Sphenostylis stenocarpa]
MRYTILLRDDEFIARTFALTFSNKGLAMVHMLDVTCSLTSHGSHLLDSKRHKIQTTIFDSYYHRAARMCFDHTVLKETAWKSNELERTYQAELLMECANNLAKPPLHYREM